VTHQKLFFDVVTFDGIWFVISTSNVDTSYAFLSGGYPRFLFSNSDRSAYRVRKDDFLVDELKHVFFGSEAFIRYQFNQDLKVLLGD